MHWRALKGGPAPSCGQQLSDLHSGRASQTPSTPWQRCTLLALFCLPLSTFPQLPRLILQYLSIFSALPAASWFPAYPRVSAWSFVQEQLHGLRVTAGGAGRAWWDSPNSPLQPVYTAQWLAEQWDELCRRLKGQTGDYTADASKQKLKIHKSFQHWQLQLSHWALFVTLKQGSSWVSSCPQAFA